MGKNKVVIISGGTSGIGLATAKILASEEWKTILLGRDMNKGRGAQEEAQGSLFIPCDVTNTRINQRRRILCRYLYGRSFG